MVAVVSCAAGAERTALLARCRCVVEVMASAAKLLLDTHGDVLYRWCLVILFDVSVFGLLCCNSNSIPVPQA